MPQEDFSQSEELAPLLIKDLRVKTEPTWETKHEDGGAIEFQNKEKFADQGDTPGVSYEIFTASGSKVGHNLEKEFVHGTTTTESLMHLLKGMIGAGVLGLPMAFKNGGLWLSLAVVTFVGLLCTHCMHLLVRTCNEISKRTQNHHLDYADVMEKALSTRDDWMKVWSNSAKNMVNMFLILLQLGVCCTYTVFVTDNVKQVLEQVGVLPVDSRIYIVIISALLVPYVMIKRLKTLAPFSAFANILNMVLPIHERMIEKSAYLGKAGVLNLGMTITVALYNAVGFYGYLKYGEATEVTITLNLPTDQWLYMCVKVVFALSVFLTYALQFYVPVQILWPVIENKLKSRSKGGDIPNYSQYVFRFILVLITCGLSALIPHLDLIIALIGASGGTFLALILPAFMDLITFECHIVFKLKNILVILLGLVGFVTGTYTTIIEIIYRY